MPVSLKPLCGKILLQVMPVPEEELRGGIIVKGRALRDGFRRAVVKRLPDRYRGGLEEGEDVLLPPFTGQEVILNKETLVLVREAELEAVLED